MCVKTTKVLIPECDIFGNLPWEDSKAFFSVELSFTNIVPRHCYIEFQLTTITGQKYKHSLPTSTKTTTYHNNNTTQQQRQQRQQHQHKSTWPWQKHKGCQKVPVLSRPSTTCKTTTTATTTTTTTEANESLKNKKRQRQKQKGRHWKQNSCSNFGYRCQQQRSNTHCWSQEFTQ